MKFVKVQRLRWAGHMARMPDNDNLKRLTMSYPEGKILKGRPRTKLLYDEEEIKIFGVRRWKQRTVAQTMIMIFKYTAP